MATGSITQTINHLCIPWLLEKKTTPLKTNNQTCIEKLQANHETLSAGFWSQTVPVAGTPVPCGLLKVTVDNAHKPNLTAYWGTATTVQQIKSIYFCANTRETSPSALN